MFIGHPGLQYILLILTVPVAAALSLTSIYFIRISRLHVYLTILFSIVTILTGLPLYLADLITYGNSMRFIGRICFGIGIPLQVIILIITVRTRKCLTSNIE